MNFALVLSGGSGSRMNMPGTVKQYIEVNNKPIVIYTLEKFQCCDSVDAIVIVASNEWQAKIKGWLDLYNIDKFIAFAEPGIQRQSSILNGINKCVKYKRSDDDIVIIHDAARPLVSLELIKRCIETAAIYGGCMPAIPVSDTIYQSNNGEEIYGLLDRRTLYAGQAPEAFRLQAYVDINNSVSNEELNSYKGTSEIAYRYGIDVRLIPGDSRNFKITTAQDLEQFCTICDSL